MAEALRELLAKLTVELDPEGNFARGNARVDAFKASVAQLEQRFAGLAAKAAPAWRAIQASFGATPGLAAAMQQQAQGRLQGLFGGFGAAQGGLAEPRSGPMLGPARAHLEDFRAASERAANSLRGRFGAALADARARAEGFKVSGRGVLDFLGSVRGALLGLGAAGAVRGAFGLVQQVGSLGERAAKLGVGVDEFQRLQVLAEQNETSVESLGQAFRVLGKNAVDPTKDSTAAFRELGVELRGADGQFRSRQDLFFDAAGALADVGDETRRAALAQQVFGRGAQELAPLLANGRAGLDAQREALSRLAVVSAETARKADEVGDRWAALKQNLLARFAPVLERVIIPAFDRLFDFLDSASGALERFSKRANLAGIAIAGLLLYLSPLLSQLRLLLTLGGGWTRTLAGMAVAAGRAALAFARLALPFLLLEDIFTFFQGGQSLTGRLMTWLFGEDAGAGIQKAAQDLLKILSELWDFVQGKGLGEKTRQLGRDLDEAVQFFRRDVGNVLGVSTDGQMNPANDWLTNSANSLAGTLGLASPQPAAGAVTQDNSTRSVTVNVGSVAEVAGAVRGAEAGLNARTGAADLAAVGGD